MLTLLTATGCRPEAWALCERWMAAQTYPGPVHWIIVDDGETPQPITFAREGWRLTVARPTPYWKPGQNTQARNLIAGLALVHSSDRLLIIEDDDHYKANWLQIAEKNLKHAELVGEGRARYYNLALLTGRQLVNARHASLCSTAMRGAAIEEFKTSCRGNTKFIDLELWRKHPSKHLFFGESVTGIKGLPGREGIGMGHDSSFVGKRDFSRELLRNWVGADAAAYEALGQK